MCRVAAAVLTALILLMSGSGAQVFAWESVGGSPDAMISESGTSVSESTAAASETSGVAESETAASETSGAAESGTAASGTLETEESETIEGETPDAQEEAAYSSRLNQEKAYMLQALDQLQEWGLSPIAIWAGITGDDTVLELVGNAAASVRSDADTLSSALSEAGTEVAEGIAESVTETVTEVVEEQTEKAKQSLIEFIREMINDFVDGL